MLSFKDFVVLIESRLDFLSNQHQGISTAHDPSAIHQDAASIVNHFATHGDPSTTKVHTGWLMNQYKKGLIRQDDAPAIKNTLASFDKHKAKLESKDLNQYKTVKDVETAVAPHVAKEADVGREKLFDNGQKQIYHVKTKEASQKHYGGGSKIGGDHTEWCTADRRDDKNLFDEYAKDGKLHTIHIKGDPDSPYQHHPSMMADRHDHSVQPDEFAEKHSDLADSLAKIHPNLASNSKHIDEWMKHKNPEYKIAAMKSPHHNRSHVDTAMKDPDAGVRSEVFYSPHHGPEHVDAGLHDPDSMVRLEALRSFRHTASHVDTAMKDPNAGIRYQAMRSKNHNVSHVDAAMKDPEAQVRVRGLMSPHHNVSHVDAGAHDEDGEVVRTAIASQHANASHSDAAMKHKDVWTRRAVFMSKGHNASHVDAGIKDKEPIVVKSALQSKHATLEHAAIAAAHPDPAVRKEAQDLKDRLSKS